MIVAMKRLELLLYHRERERFLIDLKKLGVVHIVEEEHATETPDVQQLGETIRRAQRIESLLKKAAKERTQSSALQKTAYTPEALLGRFEEIEQRIDQGNQEIATLQKDIATVEPWGNFDPAVLKNLQKAGIRIRFFIADEEDYAAIDRTAVTIEEIASIKTLIYFVVIEKDAPAQLQAEEVRLPEASLEALRKSVLDREKEIAACRSEMEALSWHVDALSNDIREKQETLSHERARLSMAEHAEGRLLSLRGWLPAEREVAVKKFLDGFSAWYDIQKPVPTDNVPVYMKNGPFSRLFEPITRLYSIPGYSELDPTPFFAPAFALFTGMCIGDFAYGLILFILALVAYVKVNKKLRPFAALIMVLGGMSVFCGLLLNSCFGMTIFGGPGISGAIVPFGAEYFAPLSPFEGPKGTEYPAMSLALVLGYLQMNLAMILQMVNRVRRNEVRTVIIPLSWMMMFFGIVVWEAHTNWFDLRVFDLTVSKLELGKLLLAIPVAVGKYICLGGVALMFLSGLINGTARVAVRPLLFLWDFYNFATGNIGYVISYIRLFALGLTTGLLAMTFNNLALGFITVDGSLHWVSPMVIFTILLLVAGNALTFVLGLVGAFVHPLRLTFVEFYQTLQFSGGGSEYRPLKRND